MRHSWLLFAAVLVRKSDVVRGRPGRAGGRPPAFDAGTVHAGAPLSHRFVLSNRGSEIVEIIETRPSCGCATATPDRRRFAPGETGSLLLAVNTLTRPDGPSSWGVTLRCRCGDRVEETTLTLTAHVRADLSLEPSALVVETAGAVDRTITLTDRREAAMSVKVETTCPQVRASVDAPTPLPTLPPRVGDGGGGLMRSIWRRRPTCPRAGTTRRCIIYTSDPEYPDLKLPFTIVKHGRQRVSATPAAVELTAASPSRLVLLRGGEGDGDEVEIGGVDADAAVRCEWTPGPRPTAAVRLRLDAAKPPADGSENGRACPSRQAGGADGGRAGDVGAAVSGCRGWTTPFSSSSTCRESELYPKRPVDPRQTAPLPSVASVS